MVREVAVEIVELFLATALICFHGTCHPALVGKATPTGSYQLRLQPRHERMFGGDILVFDEDRTSVWAIHRAHNERRRSLLAKGQRTGITGGCVNVTNEVYELLRTCCSNAKLEIK